MAFPVVETTAESSLATAGTSHVITLPSGIVAGELILILTNHGVAVASFNALTGWTELIDEAAANGNTVWVRDADGTEGASVTFTSSASTRSATIAYRISGAESIAVQVPQLSTVATGTSTTPDPSTCTPTGGAKDYLWIAMFGKALEEADDDTWTNSAPTNFTNLLQKACGVAGTNLGGMVASAEFASNASSMNPGTFSIDVSSAWRAYTIAVHPSTLQTVTPAVVTTTATLLEPTVVPGAVTLTPDTLATTATVLSPEIVGGAGFVAAVVSSATDSSSTDHIVSLPNGSDVTGRTLVAAVVLDVPATVGWPSGWTATDQSTTGVHLSVGRKIIDGTEGYPATGATITVTSTVAMTSTQQAYLIRGSHASSVPEVALVAGGPDLAPDPPSLNPTGWDVEESLWLSFAGTRFNESISAAPANYTNLTVSNSTNGDNGTLGTARRVLSTASENPGTFTIGSSMIWVTATVAVRPEGAAGDLTITPGVITTTATLFAPTVVPGAVTITPGVVSTSSTIFAPTVVTSSARVATKATTNTTTSAGSVNMNLPSGITNGDMLFAVASAAGTDRTFNSVAGWTILNQGNGGAQRLALLYRDANGSEGSTQAVTLTGTDGAFQAHCWRINGHKPGSVPEVTANTPGAATTTPNPPLHTVSGWSAYANRRASLELHGASISQALSTNYRTAFLDYIRDAGTAGGTPNRRFLGGDVIDVVQLGATGWIWVGADWFAGGEPAVDTIDDTFISELFPFRNGQISEGPEGTLTDQVFTGGGSGGEWLDADTEGGEDAGSFWWTLSGVRPGDGFTGSAYIAAHLLGTDELNPTLGVIDSSIITLNAFGLYSAHVNTGWGQANNFWLSNFRHDVPNDLVYATGAVIDHNMGPIAGADLEKWGMARSTGAGWAMARVVDTAVPTSASYEFWNGSSWVSGAGNAVRMTNSGGRVIIGLQGNPVKLQEGYWLTVGRTHVLDNHLDVYRARNPQGPWEYIARTPVNYGQQIMTDVYQVSHHATIVPHGDAPAGASMAMLTSTVISEPSAVIWDDLPITAFCPSFANIPQEPQADSPGTLFIAVTTQTPGSVTAYPLPDNQATLNAGTLELGVCSDVWNQVALDPGTFTISSSQTPRTATIAIASQSNGVIDVDVLIAPATVLAPTVLPGQVVVTPGVLTTTATVLQPTISQAGADTILPGVISAPATVLQPTIVADQVATLGLLTTTATALAPTVIAGSVTITIAVLTTTATVLAPANVGEQVDIISPGVISAPASVQAPTIVPGSVTVTQSLVSAPATINALTVTQPFDAIVLATLTASATVQTPTVVAGSVNVVVGVVATGSTVFAPTVGIFSLVQPEAISAPATVFSPTITTGEVFVVLALLNSPATVLSLVILGMAADPYPIAIGFTEGSTSISHTEDPHAVGFDTPSYSSLYSTSAKDATFTEPGHAIVHTSPSQDVEYTEGG